MEHKDILPDAPLEDLAHSASSNNMEQLQQDSLCGCFYCLQIFDPTEIEEWLIDDNAIDYKGTAVCPYCGVDSIIAKSAGYPLTIDFLQKMKKRWF